VLQFRRAVGSTKARQDELTTSKQQDEHQDTRTSSRTARVLIVARRSQRGGEDMGCKASPGYIGHPSPLYTYLCPWDSTEAAHLYILLLHTSPSPHALCASMAHAAVQTIC